MMPDDLLSRLDAVKPRGSGKWVARCPAHADTTPSLTITEGHKGSLVKCWAGCSLVDICAALHLHTRDLFYDRDPDPHQFHRRQRERQQREAAQHKQGRLIDACREAEQFIHSRVGLDISQWSAERLDRELNLLGDAYHLLEHDPYGAR
jgi:DNA primase